MTTAMKPLQFEQGQYKIGPLTPPEPMGGASAWYEFLDYRDPTEGERHLNTMGNIVKTPNNYSNAPRWIATEIPRPTPEQLAAIGKVCGERPEVVKHNDIVWEGNDAIRVYGGGQQDILPLIGRSRFILTDAPKVEYKGHWESIQGENHGHNPQLHDVWVEDAPKEVHTSCENCGRICPLAGHKSNACTRWKPKQPAEERFVVGEIDYYFNHDARQSFYSKLLSLNHPRLGISAVTRRRYEGKH